MGRRVAADADEYKGGAEAEKGVAADAVPQRAAASARVDPAYIWPAE